MRDKKTLSPWKVLGNLDLLAACIMMVVLICLTFVGVLKRYFFRSPIIWQEEVQLLLFLWVVFLAGSSAFRVGSHIAIEIVVDTLPKKLGRLVEYIDVLLQLVILGYLFMQEWAYYSQLVSTGKITNLLRLPYSIAYAVLPIGGALMIISMLVGAYRQLIKKPDQKEVDA